MAGSIRNLPWFRSITDKTKLSDIGTRLYEALGDLRQNQQTITQQANLNPSGSPQAPPQLNGMKVQAANGHFQVSIQDSAPIFRGIRYYVEHSETPNFSDVHVVPMHDSRNTNIFLGNVTRHFRAYSAYPSGDISPPVYHGSQASPIAVSGGGAIGGPDFLPSESSGTSLAGEGLSGPGSVPFRSVTGKLPVR